MRVLVTAASKHGATAGIAQAIAETMVDRGHDVDVRAPDDVASVESYDAVVVGSAVYGGHWLDAAKDVVLRNAEALRSRQLWLFSSGPIGDPPKPLEDPVDVSGLIEAGGAVGHRLFAGKLDRDQLRLAERAIVRALRAPEGDFRDWAEIRAWAGGIADRLDLVTNVSDLTVPTTRGGRLRAPQTPAEPHQRRR